MMHGLIIIAHGSRREESNQEVIALSQKVSQISQSQYTQVAHAFLEVASPDLNTAIDQLVQQSIKHITVFPYFLNSGNHIARDIPNLIKTAQATYPNIEISMSPFIGELPNMPELIMQQLQAL